MPRGRLWPVTTAWLPPRTRPFRTLFGALFAAVIWGVVGALLSSPALGVLLAAWSLLLGPLLVPTFTWWSLRLRGRVRPVDYARESTLARAYFEKIVQQPGPRPEVWVLGSADRGFFVFESLFRRKQVVVVTSGWLALSESRKRQDWDELWASLAVTRRPARLVRTVQMALWIGALSPLDVLFQALRILTDFFGFVDMPRGGFWFLGSAWRLRELWFGRASRGEDTVFAQSWGAGSPPRYWESLLWGVWFQAVPEGVHPSWYLLTRSGGFLGAEARLENPSRQR